MIRNRGESILSSLPRDIIRYIQKVNTIEHAVTDTAALLPYAIGIDGRPMQMVEQLGEQPRLLLEPTKAFEIGSFAITFWHCHRPSIAKKYYSLHSSNQFR